MSLYILLGEVGRLIWQKLSILLRMLDGEHRAGLELIRQERSARKDGSHMNQLSVSPTIMTEGIPAG
jgi:hypothetical protein